nr:MAG TPA: hypothetical protein [Caudoviricetes sp.]
MPRVKALELVVRSFSPKRGQRLALNDSIRKVPDCERGFFVVKIIKYGVDFSPVFGYTGSR